MTPASWLTDIAPLLPSAGRALDVACGRGRHALWLGRRGYETTALDRDADAIAHVNEESRRLGLPVKAEVVDLEVPGFALPRDEYDVVVVVNYLHRALFPTLLGALRPGGVLVYETFTVYQAARGKPTCADFLLKPGELRTLVAPLQVVREREGEFEGRMVASVVARRK